MSEPTQQRMMAIAVYGDRAAAATEHVTSLLTGAGVAPEEILELLAVIRAGAVESAQNDVLALAEQPLGSSTSLLVEGWGAAVRAAAAELAHIADRTIARAKSAAAPAAQAALASPSHALTSTVIAEVPQDQVERVLETAERIFAELTGRSDYCRETSLEMLPVVLRAVSAEQQAGYVAQLEDFAARNRGRLMELYSKYLPGGALAVLDRSGLTDQPESLVICERLDAAPVWLQGVWEGELEESMLERFADLWKFGCDTPRAPLPSRGH